MASLNSEETNQEPHRTNAVKEGKRMSMSFVVSCFLFCACIIAMLDKRSSWTNANVSSKVCWRRRIKSSNVCIIIRTKFVRERESLARVKQFNHCFRSPQRVFPPQPVRHTIPWDDFSSQYTGNSQHTLFHTVHFLPISATQFICPIGAFLFAD